jgi:hypothetical protein
MPIEVLNLEGEFIGRSKVIAVDEVGARRVQFLEWRFSTQEGDASSAMKRSSSFASRCSSRQKYCGRDATKAAAATDI